MTSDEPERIKTDFFAHQAREQDTPITQQGPMLVLLIIVGIGILVGAFNGLMYFINMDKNNAMKSVQVKLESPVQKEGVAFVTVTVYNFNPVPVTDPTFAYHMTSATGSDLASGKVTIPGTIPAGDSRSYAGVQLGEIKEAKGRMGADVVDLKVVGKASLEGDLGNRYINAASLPDKEALENFKDFVKRAPQFAPGYVGLGRALAANGDWDLAIKSYEKALKIDPEYANARYYLGVAHWYKKDARAARADFEEALRLEPEDPSVKRSLDNVLAALGEKRLPKEGEAGGETAAGGEAGGEDAEKPEPATE